MTESLVARARVVAVHPDRAVSVEGAAACPGCRCGRYFAVSTRRIELPPDRCGQCSVGRTLDISVAAVELLRVSLWLYGLPWLLLVLGTLLGTLLGRADAAALGGAFAGLAVGVLLLKLLARRVALPLLEVRVDE